MDSPRDVVAHKIDMHFSPTFKQAWERVLEARGSRTHTSFLRLASLHLENRQASRRLHSEIVSEAGLDALSTLIAEHVWPEIITQVFTEIALMQAPNTPANRQEEKTHD